MECPTLKSQLQRSYKNYCWPSSGPGAAADSGTNELKRQREAGCGSRRARLQPLLRGAAQGLPSEPLQPVAQGILVAVVIVPPLLTHRIGSTELSHLLPADASLSKDRELEAWLPHGGQGWPESCLCLPSPNRDHLFPMALRPTAQEPQSPAPVAGSVTTARSLPSL